MKRRRRNSKKAPRRAKKAAKSARRHARRAPRPAQDGVLNVKPLGRAVQLLYQAPGAAQLRAHQFGATVRVYAHVDGKYLVIGPVRIRGGQVEG